MSGSQEKGGPLGEVLYNEPLSRHSTWGVGGPARCYYRPADSTNLARFLSRISEEEPLLWLGLGSNLLVRDGGFPGTVIATQGCLDRMELRQEGRVRVEAGVSCAGVARFAVRHGLCGVEFLAGIPGTMGGALAMNAGAFGRETWDWVSQVETIDRKGCIRERGPGEFEIGYRSVKGTEGEWFLAALLELQPGDVGAGQEAMRELLEQRASRQPLGLPSCGSVFRNPEGDYAARLIEEAGLKGVSIGGACISEKHANFIINIGGAKATEIEQLILLVQERVEAVSGVRLQLEVRIVGRQGEGP